ncbi:TPA_exp: Uncharacterized protein A8136_3129 [Trichophyton benhamiae CBS 112371]|uniref:Aminoglycoside phosphotransferase domain-containing protein n=2 Tax=Trichophyton TaxID=5550 RepID=D4AZG2_ARTBC|nr:uncharacterized protein ARB_01580 [Trichophyton benhamiae CBS 112371]XP_003022361.1 uncharacterized protein TRV_03572 [Trichophyton verrucosum HKI 0517]EFE31432.1 hypothetical protein ARB_01580 [Trichophyton benhamiae CBS 112371]EFE41743.1 hypothetical protein TRV_03572 [Trichophyton verrucosum HKI 0517]DAA74591.1 TPA_exp: Uncharacterized protein A8136_3129 [Trichophyton benhamiae CBS 112371]
MDDYVEFFPWLEGERIFSSLGRAVVKRRRQDGEGFEVAKVGAVNENEIAVLDHISRCTTVKTAKLRGVSIVRENSIMIMDFLPGKRLDSVWKSMNGDDKEYLKTQIQEQVVLLRQCSIDYVGGISHNRYVRDPYRPFKGEFCGPFHTEADFDKHKVSLLGARDPAAAKALEEKLDALRKPASKPRFVLTHGDLCPHNILVQNVGEGNDTEWRITGIIDWERSGFFPDYMEYTIAMTSEFHDPEWKQFLNEVFSGIGLQCSPQRVEAEALAVERLFGEVTYFGH